MSQGAALFGGPRTTHLLQFKAGKMTLDSDNWVRPDPRKGWVYVYLSDDKLHLCWIDRKTCLVEDNFVIDTQQAEFKKVAQCTTGRVYLLKLENSKKFFVWMQEPNGKNDNDICSKINDFIVSPSARTAASAPFNAPSSDWLNSLSGFNQSDLLALLSMGVGFGSGLSSESDVSSAQATAVTTGRHLNTGHLESRTNPTSTIPSTAPTPNVATGSAGTNASSTKRNDKEKIKLQYLRDALSTMSGPPKQSEIPIDLNDAVNLGTLRTLLEKPEVQARLLPLLPSTDPELPPAKDAANIMTNVQSSQFKSTLKSFSAAFQTGELAHVLSEFKLGAKADEAAKTGDLVAFSKALQDTNNTSTVTASGSGGTQEASSAAKSKPNEEPTGAEKDKSGETAMDTD